MAPYQRQGKYAARLSMRHTSPRMLFAAVRMRGTTEQHDILRPARRQLHEYELCERP